jgi:riboflavin synthase
MFAGIVEGTATVLNIDLVNGVGATIKLDAAFSADIGASVAVNGVCLTVVSCKDNILEFQAINETLSKTNLGLLNTGSLVNVERSLKIGDRIDGHFVSGHVDAVGQIINKTKDGSSTVFDCSFPCDLKPFIAQKGSITINGVALTVGEVFKDSFRFYIIPHTEAVTNLKQLEIGTQVNLEIDLLARYVVNACNKT